MATFLVCTNQNEKLDWGFDLNILSASPDEGADCG